MQSWLAVCWMQSMHIFVIFRIGIMDGWTRKAARSECRQGVARQVKGICSSLNCELFPGRGGLLPVASREYWLLGELTPRPRVSCQICSEALARCFARFLRHGNQRADEERDAEEKFSSSHIFAASLASLIMWWTGEQSLLPLEF